MGCSYPLSNHLRSLLPIFLAMKSNSGAVALFNATHSSMREDPLARDRAARNFDERGPTLEEQKCKGDQYLVPVCRPARNATDAPLQQKGLRSMMYRLQSDLLECFDFRQAAFGFAHVVTPYNGKRHYPPWDRSGGGTTCAVRLIPKNCVHPAFCKIVDGLTESFSRRREAARPFMKGTLRPRQA